MSTRAPVARALQFVVCPQNDFVGLPQDGGELPRLHVGTAGLERLRRSGSPGDDPLVDTVLRISRSESVGGPPVWLILDEDWHTADADEFAVFGRHCVKGTVGAALPERMEPLKWDHRTYSIRANSINIAATPRYGEVLRDVLGTARLDSVHVGVLGVWTHLRVELLVLNLMTLAPRFSPGQIGVCEPLCASPDMADHGHSIRKLRSLGVNILEDVESYGTWLLGVPPPAPDAVR